MKKKNSIGNRIVLSYIITVAIVVILVVFVIWSGVMTTGNLTKIDDYVTFFDYPMDASMVFANARVKNRIMMSSIFYDDSVYSDGLAHMGEISSIFSDFRTHAGKYNLTTLISQIDNAMGELGKYESLMKDNDVNNKEKRAMQTVWAGQGTICVNALGELNTYVNGHMTALMTDISQREFSVAYNNKVAVENLRGVFTIVRLDAREMMYMDETKNYQKILDDVDNIIEMLSEYESIAYAEILPAVRELRDAFGLYKETTIQFYDLIQHTAATAKTFEGINEELQTYLKAIINETTDIVQNRVESSISQQTLVLTVLIVLSIALIAFVVIYAVLLIKSITGSLALAASALKESVENIDGAARQLSSAANSLAESGSKQAASIEETSATMNQTASMVKQNTENTRKAATLATDTMNATADSVQAMENVINFMNELSTSSNEIKKIVGDINAIASQTNILALNASVEAVRAGDAGKSFSVVAEEVRTLSNRSTESANSTAAIINDNIALSSKSVQNCIKAGDTLKTIFSDIQNVNIFINEIFSASEEQTRGVQQINIAMSEMEKVTQANAAISQESASAANELTTQSENLSQIYAEIDALVYGT